MLTIQTNTTKQSEAKADSKHNDAIHEQSVLERPSWKGYQKILFRIAFVFFILMSIPTDAAYYVQLVGMDWTSLHYRDLYDLARFSSGFRWVGNTLFGSPLMGYANWVITLLVAIGAGLVWSLGHLLVKRDVINYDLWYYWLRAIVRYRAGIGIIGFGFTKLLPTQMPYPSEGLLNTAVGDFTAQKIFWLSIGIVPWYQVFTGVVELLAGALLFFRKTEALGAALLISALGTITYVNFAYEGGVHVYASYFTLYGVFILGYYVPRLYRLLILEKVTVPVDYFPDLSKGWAKFARITVKSLIIGVFLVWFAVIQVINFLYDPYKQPSIAGIPELRGYYDVVEFRLNGEVLPPDPLSTDRWQEVTFEKWSTMTYRVNRAHLLDLSNGGGSPMRDINRTFEIAGVGGGRKAFYYEVDPIDQVLFLQDKNTAGLRRTMSGENQSDEERFKKATIYPDDWISQESKSRLKDEIYQIEPVALTARRKREIPEELAKDVPREKMVLKYQIFDDGQEVLLTGTNETLEPIEIKLRRKQRDYLLSRSTLDAGKYE